MAKLRIARCGRSDKIKVNNEKDRQAWNEKELHANCYRNLHPFSFL